jgi:hypothetical protein
MRDDKSWFYVLSDLRMYQIYLAAACMQLVLSQVCIEGAQGDVGQILVGMHYCAKVR